MIEKLIDGYCKLIGYLIAAMLAVMVPPVSVAVAPSRLLIPPVSLPPRLN